MTKLPAKHCSAGMNKTENELILVDEFGFILQITDFPARDIYT